MDQDLAFSDNRPVVTPARRVVEGPPPPEPAIVDPAEHNVVFTTLVTGDQDVVGLVAYSIYKQNKYDWLMAFNQDQSRMPNEAEVHSYLIGESTTRRLATYRHLAEATLEGRGIEVPGISGPVSGPRTGTSPQRLDPAGPADGSRLQRIVLIAVIAVIVAILGLLWLMHGGLGIR